MKRIFIICNIIIFLILSMNINSQTIKWELIFFDFPSMFGVGIDKLDSLNAVVLFAPYGAGRIVKKTSDAGITWEDIYIDTLDITKGGRVLDAFDISYPTKDYIIFTCDENIYIKSTDGGKTWKEGKIESSFNDKSLRRVNMLDSKYGIITKFYYLYYSNDGFETYQKIVPGEFKYNFAKSFLMDSNKIYGVAVNIKDPTGSDTLVKFMKSYDKGKSWIITSIRGLGVPSDIVFLDSLIGYISGFTRIGSGGQASCEIYKTTDGGNTWKSVLFDVPPVSFGLQRLDCIDKENCVAVGQGGNVYWKLDNNKNWVRDKDTLPPYMYLPTFYVCMFNKTTAVTVDFSGRILRSYLPTDVEENPNFKGTIYPNPASDYIYVNVGARHDFPSQDQIEIYNIFGLKVSTSVNFVDTSSNGAQIKIDISNFTAGVYFIKIGNKFGKFVKM